MPALSFRAKLILAMMVTVTAATGGRQGGGAALTASGERVIALYRSIENIARSSAKEEFRAVGKLVRKRRGPRIRPAVAVL